LGSSYEHIAATLFRLGVGFAVGYTAGAALGLLAGRVKTVFDFVSNIAWIAIAVPEVVWAFVLVVVLGITDVVPILAVAVLLGGVVFINVSEGAKVFSIELAEMAQAFKASRTQMVLDVWFPQTIPFLLGSARIAFALGIKLIVIAEIVGLSRGIGFQLSYWHTKIQVAPIVAWGIVLVIVALSIEYGVFTPLQRRLTRWKAY
jgi:NitT/TauT family transport system permease protein